MKLPNFDGLYYDDKVFSLRWVGAQNPANQEKTPLEMLKEAETVFEKMIGNAKKIIRAGVGDDHVGFFKGWQLTLKGGQYGRKARSNSKGEEVRKESD